MYVNLFERHNTSWVESISRSAASKLAPPSGGKRRQAAALQNIWSPFWRILQIAKKHGIS
jgi:hypothetical protein